MASEGEHSYAPTSPAASEHGDEMQVGAIDPESIRPTGPIVRHENGNENASYRCPVAGTLKGKQVPKLTADQKFI